MSPNWRLPSMRTVRSPSWPMATARLNARVVLPTPPLGANTVIMRAVPAASADGCRLLGVLDAASPARSP